MNVAASSPTASSGARNAAGQPARKGRGPKADTGKNILRGICQDSAYQHEANNLLANSAAISRPDRFRLLSSPCSPRNEVNRIVNVARASGLLQLNNALDSGFAPKESAAALNRQKKTQGDVAEWQKGALFSAPFISIIDSVYLSESKVRRLP
jgi:hypothetical protein